MLGLQVIGTFRMACLPCQFKLGFDGLVWVAFRRKCCVRANTRHSGIASELGHAASPRNSAEGGANQVAVVKIAKLNYH